MHESIPFIIIFAIVILAMPACLYAWIQCCGWEQLEKKYSYTDPVPVKMKHLQNILLNRTCFNGMFSIGMSDLGVFMKFKTTVFIPFSDLELTDKRKYFRYKILKVKNSDLPIGLETKWITKIPNQEIESTR